MRPLTQALRLPAALLVLLTISSCAAGSTAEPTIPPTNQESTVTPSSSCTGSGAYRLVPSINGSTPALPHSGQGKVFTPRVGLAGTRDTTPPTANISISAEAPDPSPVFFNGMQLGSEATVNGYTIKITSICDNEVFFDLIKQPE
jgi:hypothetical protein